MTMTTPEMVIAYERLIVNLMEEIARLRTALTFYAERRNLHIEWSGETQIRDRGEVARAALDGTPPHLQADRETERS